MIIIFNPVTAIQKLKQNAFGKYIFKYGWFRHSFDHFKTKEIKKNHIQRASSLAVTFSHQPTTPSESHQMSVPPGILHVWELQCLHLGGVHQLILLGDQDLQTIRKEFFSQDTVGN